MHKIMVPIIFLISLSIVLYVSLISAREKEISELEALEIGEEKYLQFLWMVDGAFNSERLKEEMVVNGKTLKQEDKVFTCQYPSKKSNECIGNNFDDEFKKLFSKDINFEKVYSDGFIYSWITIKNGQYVFDSLNNCSINRMGNNQELKVVSISNLKLVYEVSFINRQNSHINKREFVLSKEDGKWKISSAFYHDLCGMWYTIY